MWVEEAAHIFDGGAAQQQTRSHRLLDLARIVVAPPTHPVKTEPPRARIAARQPGGFDPERRGSRKSAAGELRTPAPRIHQRRSDGATPGVLAQKINESLQRRRKYFGIGIEQ